MSLESELEQATSKAVGGFHASNVSAIVKRIATDAHYAKIDAVVASVKSSFERAIGSGAGTSGTNKVIQNALMDVNQTIHEQVQSEIATQIMAYMREWSTGNAKSVLMAAMQSAKRNLTDSEVKAAVQGFQKIQMSLAADRVHEIMQKDAQNYINAEVTRFGDTIMSKAGLG